jgi:hypothetical protein
MKHKNYEAVLAFALRGIRWLLMAMGSVFYLAAVGARLLGPAGANRARWRLYL